MTPQQNALIDIENELSEAEACIDRAITAFKKTWPNSETDTDLIGELRGLLDAAKETVSGAAYSQMDAWQAMSDDE